jgi:osmotically-inducible protein OsmY
MTRTPALQRFAIALTAGAALVMGLGACVPLVVGAGAVGAGMVATDRRTSGAQLDDTTIEVRGAARIREIANDNMNVTVISYNRQVLLTGTVASDADKRRAEEVVGRIDNVRNVVNEVVVGPASSITDRSNDTFITSKVKASLVDQKDIFANTFKVTTERGVVYLMGIATPREITRATDVTRGVEGVKKVVRIVEQVPEGTPATSGGTGTPAPAVNATPSSTPAPASSSGGVALPPMAPLPPANSAPVLSPGAAPAGGGAVTSPVR